MPSNLPPSAYHNYYIDHLDAWLSTDEFEVFRAMTVAQFTAVCDVVNRVRAETPAKPDNCERPAGGRPDADTPLTATEAIEQASAGSAGHVNVLKVGYDEAGVITFDERTEAVAPLSAEEMESFQRNMEALRKDRVSNAGLDHLISPSRCVPAPDSVTFSEDVVGPRIAADRVRAIIREELDREAGRIDLRSNDPGVRSSVDGCRKDHPEYMTGVADASADIKAVVREVLEAERVVVQKVDGDEMSPPRYDVFKRPWPPAA